MHQQQLDRIELLQHRIVRLLESVLHLEHNVMGQLEDLVTALDSETNAVAKKIDELTSALASAVAANQAPKAETLTALGAISDRLKALCADRSAPIPPATPTEPPTSPVG